MSATRPSSINDWLCTRCHYSCFASRSDCRKCGAPRTGSDSRAAESRSTSEGSLNADNVHTDSRRYFDKLMKNPQLKLDDQKSAEAFLEAIQQFTDLTELINRLTAKSECGLQRIKSALTGHDGYDNPVFVNRFVIPLLHKLGSDALSRGVYKRALDSILYELFMIQQWISDMIELIYRNKINDPIPIGWLILQSIRLSDERGENARKNIDLIQSIAGNFQCSPSAALKELGKQFNTVMNNESNAVRSRTAVALEDLKYVAGGRHSNDHYNYRSIHIVPTPDELVSKELPYLPLAIDCQSEAEILDRNFRLMREDFIEPLRNELSIDAKEDRRMMQRTFLRSRVLRCNSGYISPEEKQANGGKKKAFQNCNYIEVTFQHSLPAAGKSDWWDRHPRVLSAQSLVCLTKNGAPICFGQVSERDIKLLGRKQPIIGITPCSQYDLKAFLVEQIQASESILVQCDASFFACEPIMRQLQNMTQISFAEELVHCNPIKSTEIQGPAYESLRYTDKVNQLKSEMKEFSVIRTRDRSGTLITLDSSQSQALIMGLTHRVALVQGPPGTGKSYVGALLAQLIYNYTDEVIMCVCYTNHALDQFLLDLIDHGIPRSAMVRIGGGKKVHSSLEDIMLDKLITHQTATRQFGRQYGAMARNIEECQQRVELIQSQLNINPNILAHLKRFHNTWFNRFHIQQSRSNNSMQLVGKGGKKIGDSYLIDEWERGSLAVGSVLELLKSNNKYSSAADQDIWKLKKSARKKLMDGWIFEITNELLQEYTSAINELTRAQTDMKSLKSEKKSIAIQDRRIIGCTTTGAAIYHDLLETIRSGVLVVEEAGEILESHILTALSSKPKHLIMIGDHQQLRPKVNKYEFQVESGRGYNLNISLFERMVKSNYPFSTLSSQHRMHQKISNLVRHITYPNLKDDIKITDLSRPMIAGLQDRLIFIDHRELEDSSVSIKQRNEDGSSNSKVNQFEVNMIIRTLIYLIQQGYTGDDIVILTPYLGQLAAIRDALKRLNNIKADLSELDANDLAQAESKQNVSEAEKKQVNSSTANNAKTSTSTQPKTPIKQVRLATIDNYQGEESNIVLISLVRSNPAGIVGFIGQKERVNVMLSRARNGMIIIGNRQTLETAKNKEAQQLWQKTMKLLDETNSVHTGLPVVCQRHPEERHIIDQPQKFDQFVSDGGCRADCGVKMSCGNHFCPRKCHPNVDHSKVECKHVMNKMCAAGHMISFKCCEKDLIIATQCKHCDKINLEKKRREEASARVLQELAEKAAIEQAEVEKRKSKLDLLRTEIAAAQLSKERELESARITIETELEESKLKLQNQYSGELLQTNIDQLKQSAQAQLQLAQQSHELKIKRLLDNLLRKQEAMQKQANRTASDTTTVPQSIFDAIALGSESKSNVGTNINNASSSNSVQANSNITFPHFCNSCQVTSTNPSSLKQHLDSSRHRNRHEHPNPSSTARTSTATVQAAAIPLPASISRGIQLLIEKKYVEASKFFKERAVVNLIHGAEMDTNTDYANMPEPLANESNYFLAICQYHLTHSAAIELSNLNAFNYDQHSKCISSVVWYTLTLLNYYANNNNEAEFYGNRLLEDPNYLSLPSTFQLQVKDILNKLSQAHSNIVPFQMSDADQLKSEWEHERDIRNAKSLVMNELMELIGLVKVKRMMLNIFNQAHISKQQGVNLSKQRFNIILNGNPGIGKTTVARLYGKFMIELGILGEKAIYRETTGTQLAEAGVDGLKKLLAEIDSAGGGLLFVDETYQLVQSGSYKGGPVLNLLLTEMENKIGKLVIAFAGYQKDMESVLKFNEGLPSRFPFSFIFDDYSDSELLQIAKLEWTKRNKDARQPFIVEDGFEGKYMQAIIRRIGRGRGRIGFGNARSVQNMINQILARQIERIQQERNQNQIPDLFSITAQDIIGKRPSKDLLHHCKPWAKLQAMIGLDTVKSAILGIVSILEDNYELELDNKPPKDVSLNRVFIGNPGVGKTVVAELFGLILKDLGILSKGDLVKKSTSDFIGSVIGQSENQTKDILTASEGCVLVIDEAYGLNPKKGLNSHECPFRKAAVDTLVEKVQNQPGDDRCVLMLGYRNEMAQFFNDCNPGATRRFGWDKAIDFPDYTQDELSEILLKRLKENSIYADSEAILTALDILNKQKEKLHFGNAGSVNNLVDLAIANQAQRLSHLSAAERAKESSIISKDFNPDLGHEVSIDSIFSDIIGCENVLNKLHDLKSSIEFEKKRGRPNPFADIPRNFLFVGEAGTGKTSVARLMGTIFHSLGVLASATVIEKSASNFTTGYIGQSGIKTIEILREGLGSVLFIDEAYRLNPRIGGQYAREILDELVNALTSTEFKGKLVVILAGYTSDMNELLQVNQGLASRFSERYEFLNFSVKDCWQVLKQKLRMKEYILDSQCDSQLSPLMNELIQCRGWGNGRDLETLARKLSQYISKQPTMLNNDNQFIVITAQQLQHVMKEMLEEKSKSNSTSSPSIVTSDSPVDSQRQAHSEASFHHISTAQSSAKKSEKEPQIEAVTETDSVDGRDQGVTDSIWLELIISKQIQDEIELKREQELERLKKDEEDAKLLAEYELEELNALIRKKQLEEDVRRSAIIAQKLKEKEEAMRKQAEELRQLIKDREALIEEKKREIAIQAKLQHMGRCVAGYNWIKQSGGYRCAGGSHFVSSSQLGI